MILHESGELHWQGYGDVGNANIGRHVPLTFHRDVVSTLLLRLWKSDDRGTLLFPRFGASQASVTFKRGAPCSLSREWRHRLAPELPAARRLLGAGWRAKLRCLHTQATQNYYQLRVIFKITKYFIYLLNYFPLKTKQRRFIIRYGNNWRELLFIRGLLN